MQIHIIAVGKVKEPFLRDGIAEYEKRLRPYLKLRIVEIPEEKRPQPAPPAAGAAAMEKEGQRILAAIPDGSLVAALDIGGRGLTSREFAASLRAWELAGRNPVAFILGGDLGLAPQVLDRSDLRLSLSPMTFTHPMARFILLEQVYRACRINSGEPYHK
jgi:23S rRNA (pseudouridine1915-N3)-methyltransferase